MAMLCEMDRPMTRFERKHFDPERGVAEQYEYDAIASKYIPIWHPEVNFLPYGEGVPDEGR